MPLKVIEVYQWKSPSNCNIECDYRTETGQAVDPCEPQYLRDIMLDNWNDIVSYMEEIQRKKANTYLKSPYFTGRTSFSGYVRRMMHYITIDDTYGKIRRIKR